MVRHDETVALAWALQHYAVLLGAPPGIVCSTVHDPCRCLIPLMKSDDLLSASILKVVEEEQATSQNPAEETSLLGEEPEFWEE